MGLVHSINFDNDWYDKILYGDAKDKNAPYYTTKATQEREEIVAKVRSSLSEDEWNILKLQLIEEGK